jgi:predicted transcriptional regulator
MSKYLTVATVREDLRFLADSMSTHKALADKIGISQAYLCDVLEGRRDPGPIIIRFLKLKKVTMYKEVGP